MSVQGKGRLISSWLGAIFLCLNPQTVKAEVKINELVVEPNPEWVELFNASESAEYLKSYWLDDDTDFESDSGSSAKKSLANLKTDNPSYPYLEFSSFLNNGGDWVVVFDSQGKLIDSYHYDQSPGEGVAIGRWPDKTGELAVLEESTQGRANAQALASPNPSPSPEASSEADDEEQPSASPSLKASPIPSPNNQEEVREEEASVGGVLGLKLLTEDENEEEEKAASQSGRSPYLIPASLMILGSVLTGGAILAGKRTDKGRKRNGQKTRK